jgi:hypothetical protein
MSDHEFDAAQVSGFDPQFYGTPPWCTRSLLSRVRFVGPILEPCCGRGHISEVLIGCGYGVESSDLVNWGYGAVENFFLRKRPAENIVTNPPFDNAENIIRHALRLGRRKVAMLLPLTFLSGLSRQVFFTDTAFPLSRVYVFRRQVKFIGIAGPPVVKVVAWFVWDREHSGEPTIAWL